MPTIHITKSIQLDKDNARQEIQRLAEKLGDELSASYAWKGDVLEFKRSGASGHISIDHGEVDIIIKLGLALSPLKKTIEKKIHSYLDERWG
jgi:putative polyhydroxyalkanoate system protein